MKLEVIILAAGQGTRMKSDLPKVLHPVAGRPLLAHVLDAAASLQPEAVHVVVGHGAQQVQDVFEGRDINWVEQTEQLGTGHAVQQAMPAVAADSTVVVLYGDVPLILPQTLTELAKLAVDSPALLTAQVAQPQGLGRILRDSSGALTGVVEEKDADQEQRGINEINTGVLAAPAADLLAYLPAVGKENAQGEYYLPDILSLAVADGKTVLTVTANTELEVLGVNDRVQLNQVEREYQRRNARQLMLQGVSIADVNRLDVRGDLSCDSDVTIDVNVVIEGVVSLGKGVEIGPNCVLRNVEVGNGAVIHAMSHLEEARVGADASVGPYARLRPGTNLGEGARIGNFVETKKANIGAGSKANHLAYIGDCEMGEDVNIGAGTITCNYDGANKHRTNIGDGVFVGSNSTLVAPIEIADGGFVGAGSVITKPVATDELAVSRARQRNLTGWQRPEKPQEKD